MKHPSFLVDLTLQAGVAGTHTPDGKAIGVAVPHGMQSHRPPCPVPATAMFTDRAPAAPVPGSAASTRYFCPFESTSSFPMRSHTGVVAAGDVAATARLAARQAARHITMRVLYCSVLSHSLAALLLSSTRRVQSPRDVHRGPQRPRRTVLVARKGRPACPSGGQKTYNAGLIGPKKSGLLE